MNKSNQNVLNKEFIGYAYDVIKKSKNTIEIKNYLNQAIKSKIVQSEFNKKHINQNNTFKQMSNIITSDISIKHLMKLATSLSKEDFQTALTNPENLASIKLTKKEMEALAGGRSGFKCYAMGLGSVLCSAGSMAATLGAGCVLSSFGCASYITDHGGF